MRRKIYLVAGANTISMGTGRKEFNPKKERPGLESYIHEAGQAVLKQVPNPSAIDETVIGNFMASVFNKQGHLGGFAATIDPDLEFKPSLSVEGACASGGLAIVSGIRSVLAETADVVLAMGVEVQNTVKAIYGADFLAYAGWFQNRKKSHAYFFPGQFSDRAGVYYEKYGFDNARKGMGRWFKNAIENARLDPTAQEHHNTAADLEGMYHKMTPNGKNFVDHLNIFDCSKVSDGASGILIASEEGLKKLGIPKKDAVEIIGFAQFTRNITNDPPNPLELTTIRRTAAKALENAGISIEQIGTIETHDCFSIAGILSVEALGLAAPGEGAAYVAAGKTARDGVMPMNTTGGLIGWGHPTGATGVHQAVTIWQQLTANAGDAQIKLSPEKPYGLSINMGGDDVTVVAIVYKMCNE
ncbi:MAG: beta-ketoacyl synthase N-terminal-like domain-containing protein [Bacteroidales bacterium]|nr:beta-ketoacyl synthase N-terminal-like domain-containing protein [Bacteroidales bacterium]